MRSVRRITDERSLTVLLFILVLGIYSTTVCPTVTFTDNGELATVASTLGIAHPTGYPLFSLLGRIASIPAVTASVIAQLNFAAAVATALAVCLFFHVLLTARRAVRLFGGKEPSDRTAAVACAIGASAFAFSETVWHQATALEVYALHLVLMLAAMLFFLRGLEEQLRTPGSVSRFLLAFAFTLGLSFTNHMTTILLAPAFLYLYYSSLGFHAVSHRRILRLVPFFFLGLSVYAYLPIRSAVGPPVDWGHPAGWESFVRHVSGWQFRVWMFSGSGVMQKQIAYFVSHFFSEFNAVLLPLVLLGGWVSIRRGRRHVLFLLLLFVTTVLYASNYDIFDIDAYFLTAYVVVGWCVALGVEWVRDRIRRERPAYLALGIGAIVVCGTQVALHHGAVDAAENFLVEDHVRNVLDGIPAGGMYISGQWDYTVSPLVYYQTVEQVRSDVAVVDKNLLMNRPWYFAQLARTYPGIFSGVEAERDAFLEQLVRFEGGKPFDSRLIQARWDAFLGKFLRMRLADRPIVVDPKVYSELPQVGRPVLDGLSIRVTQDTTWQPMPRNLRFRPWKGDGILVRDLKATYVSALLQQAILNFNEGQAVEARMGIEKALQVDPGNRSAQNLRQSLFP